MNRKKNLRPLVLTVILVTGVGVDMVLGQAMARLGASETQEVSEVGLDMLSLGAVFNEAGGGYAYPTGTPATSMDFTRTFLEPPSLAVDDRFGRSVAAVGSNVIAGAPLDDSGATNTGAAYLFDGSTGALLRTFLNPTPGIGDQFGDSVAGVGSNVLVGAFLDDTGAADAGAAYLFDGSNGALLRTFLNPTPAPDDRFGFSVAPVGPNVLVGAPRDDSGAIDAGVAYLFDGLTGALLLTFPNPTPDASEGFGFAVAGVGPSVLVGAPLAYVGADRVGVAYLFDGSTGALLRTFQKPAPVANDEFGFSVAAVISNVLVGAHLDDPTGALNAGAAYLFDGSTGALLRTFQQPTPTPHNKFGYSVAATGSNVLVGAPLDSLATGNGGAVYLFDGSTGAHIRTFLKSTPVAFDYFGFSVASLGASVLVGALLDDLVTSDAGAVYMFDGSTSILLRTFLSPTPATADLFGWDVAAVGSNVLVGAFLDDTGATDAGAVYMFDGSSGALLRTFLNPTPATAGRFGGSVASVGSNVLVGAKRDDTAAADAGAVYLFDGSTGTLLRTFLNPTPAAYDEFGQSVAAVGSNVLVGAEGDDTAAADAGAVYLFDGSTGALLRTFLSPTPATADRFGFSIAGFGSNVLVGALRGDTGAVDAGAAYLFDGSTGALLRTFLNPTPDVSDAFGVSVAAVGSNVLIGAGGDDSGAFDAGAAYLFDGSTGALLHTFLNPAPAGSDQFGNSVAALGLNVLVGAWLDDVSSTDAGAAYLFDGSTGTLIRAFQNPTPAVGDRFGVSVAAVGGNVLVGTPFDDTGTVDAGAAYLFDSSTGTLLRTLQNPTPAPGDEFGFSVAAVGSNVLVGARYDDTRATDAGAAYLFLWDGDANGDGSVTQADADLITSLIGSAVSCQKNQVTCHADVDNDLDIDSSDVGASMMSLGLTISEDPDVDGDSDVDIDDLISVFLNQFRQPCPPGSYLTHMDFDNDCDIDIDDLIGVFLSQFKPWPPS